MTARPSRPEDEVREVGDVAGPTPQPGVLSVLDGLDALVEAATTLPDSGGNAEWEALIQARAEALRVMPELTAALRAVQALAEELEDEATDARQSWDTLAAKEDAADRLRTALAALTPDTSGETP